jgi:hypothetical protein
VAAPTAAAIASAIVSNPPTVPTTPPSHASTNVDELGGTAVDTNSGNKSAGTLRVVVATDQPNLTTALNVHDASPSAISIASAQKIEVYDGTNTAVVKAASTAAADTDTSLVVQLNPKQPNLDTALNVHDASPASQAVTNAGTFAVQAACSGTVTTTPPSHASTNVDEWNGTAVDTNSGNKSAGTLRVVVATDQPNLTTALNVHDPSPSSVAVTQSTASSLLCENIPTDGTHPISAAMAAIGVAPTGTYLETINTVPIATSAGGASSALTQALTTKINLVGAAAKLLSYAFSNPNTTVVYFSLYNTASTPAAVNTTGATLLWEIMVPIGGAANFNFGDIGLAFSAGIAVSVHTGEADTVAPNTGCTISIQYK